MDSDNQNKTHKRPLDADADYGRVYGSGYKEYHKSTPSPSNTVSIVFISIILLKIKYK
jgi:hypothetical protein